MTDSRGGSRILSSRGVPQADEVHVTLPCAPDHIAEFIAGLLGKPQTISRSFEILFEIDHHDIESLHHLIVQRVTQQNDASLVQFVIQIFYNDNSSVRINSFDDFSRYSEVRPLRSIAVTLNWIFLIRFQDRPHAEKQEINIRFATPENSELKSSHLSDGRVVVYPRPAPKQGLVEAAINHTARTWGNDVDGLIKDHIETCEKGTIPYTNFSMKTKGGSGFWCFLEY
jgi:hypothetical protein